MGELSAFLFFLFESEIHIFEFWTVGQTKAIGRKWWWIHFTVMWDIIDKIITRLIEKIMICCLPSVDLYCYCIVYCTSSTTSGMFISVYCNSPNFPFALLWMWGLWIMWLFSNIKLFTTGLFLAFRIFKLLGLSACQRDALHWKCMLPFAQWTLGSHPR